MNDQVWTLVYVVVSFDSLSHQLRCQDVTVTDTCYLPGAISHLINKRQDNICIEDIDTNQKIVYNYRKDTVLGYLFKIME